jgi:predicted HTH transcriptional regulator
LESILPKKSRIKAVKRPDKSQIELPKIEDKILDIIKITPDISIPKLAIELDRTPDSIRYYLRQLVQDGRVRHEGSRRSGKWIIL